MSRAKQGAGLRAAGRVELQTVFDGDARLGNTVWREHRDWEVGTGGLSGRGLPYATWRAFECAYFERMDFQHKAATARSRMSEPDLLLPHRLER